MKGVIFKEFTNTNLMHIDVVILTPQPPTLFITTGVVC